MFLIIDGGTTNLRVTLLSDERKSRWTPSRGTAAFATPRWMETTGA